MSTSTFVGNPDGLMAGLCPAPPPPPPPPPAPGQVPAMRINTAEAPTMRRPQIASNDAYEPPAAIQNAMLTKDKKPFTYTPGMGGKLDLSQIRSPRMARRVAKNANDEGIEGPPKSALEPKPTPPPNAGVNLFIQPQVAIPVFPTNVPVQPPANRTPSTPPANKTPQTPPGNRTPPTPPGNRTPPTSPASKTPSNGLEKQPELNKVTPTVTISVQPSTPESPNTPTQVTLAKAPTPWLQNKNKPQEELPEWAKRPGAGKLSSSPDSPTSPPVYVSVQQPPLWQPAQQKQQPAQQRPQSQQPQQYQYQQPPQQFSQQQQKRPYSSPPGTQSAQSQQPERVIPIRLEDRPSVFDVNREGGHHQFKQTSPHHQQRWGPPTAPNQMQNQVQQPATPIQPQQSSGGAFIIPVMVEGSEKKAAGGPASNAGYSQPVVRNNTPNVENQTVRMAPQRGPVPVVQPDSGPVQSRSFRVLQKITDTDSTNDVDPEQIRKLQLSDDDRILMNRVKEQVDNDCFLHQEEDPRYRGAAIPSRAFRFLQTMTEGGDAPVAPITPRPQSAINKRVNRNSKTFEETQANLPPSEQQVLEPKKYMGSAIPSRSFRILQAMTAPESIATQENRQADYTCQTENNVPGNQQGVFLPPCPPPFWSPDGGWWGYYPLPYPGVANGSYPHPDHTAYIYFPIYNQNYPGYPQFDVNPLNTDKTACTGAQAPSCVAPARSAICTRSGQGGSAIVPNMEPAGIPEDRSNEGKAQEDIAELNGLNGLPRWRGNSDRGNSVSRTPSTHSKDSDCTTAMNITDEEEIPEVMAASEGNDSQPDNLEKKPCANGSLNVAVPNYTYIDTSDSTDSTDSESQSDNESVIETSKSDRVSEDTTSDSEDSDSYMAYSLGLNPHGRFDKDTGKSGARTGSHKEALNSGHESENTLEKNNSDSEREEQVDGQIEEAGSGSFPHKLSVIYEDVEHADAESPRPQEPRGGWNMTPFEATDDPPDEQDTTTVSVSLPLRFKFSVSENNEDVTTVIVGDSTVKPERVYSKEETRGVKAQEQRSLERTEEVSANFLVDNDTSVDFTVKREKADTRRPRNHSKETEKEEVAERKADKCEDAVVPHVNFTLRKIPTRLSRMNCGETIETEFTVKRKTSARKEESRDKEQNCSDTSTKTILNGESLGEEVNPIQTAENTVHASNMKESSIEPLDYNKNILKPEVVVSECKDPGSLHSANPKMARSEKSEDSDSSKSNRKEEDPEREPTKEPRHLLSVQNSKDETDDEDSGVTSDMSRMISEVDTDSECTSTRNRKYQRTQTHSRLFKLLNDDSVLPEDIEKTPDPPSRRDYLSLPLKNSFNYDDNYCSNYSSGLTSPDYSPLCEQTWRRLHDTERPNVTTNPRPPVQDGDAGRDHGHPLSRQERAFCKDDPYYQSWKTCKSPTSNDHDVLPSQAFKVLESRRPLWSYRVNVLCPRIKSTKSVPVALGAGKIDSPLISPNPSAYVTLRNDRC
ncbi:uncharacterized protein LOC143378456 isoform X2 [Andrena cerasifolii]|uniref:uncharacterized protein LOC143378456 isoform X2 n=1 Tax=Andrena cerasifolii TaxID=2819439 RepID=UPI004037D16D